MVISPPGVLRGATIAGLFAAATAVESWLVRPFQDGPGGADAAASVLFFDRIVAGRHLEIFLNTTPKPLLTVVLGGLHAITGDWRPGALASVLVAALGVILAGELVRRVAGLEAGLFAGVAVVGLASFQAETSWSYGLPWAFALWMAAGLLLIRPRPRYGGAGVMLLLAGLARPETFILLGVAVLALAWLSLRGMRPPRAAWLLMLGWLAIVVYCVHDLLLTGDPLWWTRVAVHSVELAGGRARSLAGVGFMSVTLLRSMLLLAIAACGGGLWLLRRRSWIAAAGVIAMGPLVAVYTWVLAATHLNVLSHYLDPIDLAIALAAAAGVGLGLVEARCRVALRFPRIDGPPALAVACAAAVVLAVVLSSPFTPLSPGTRTSTALEARIATRLVSLEGVLDHALSADRTGPASDPGPMGPADLAGIRLFVPAHRLIRLALDLGLPLTRIAGLDPLQVNLARGYPAVGSIVYIDGSVEVGSVGPGTVQLQVKVPTTIGHVVVVPIKTDPATRLWIVRIDRAP